MLPSQDPLAAVSEVGLGSDIFNKLTDVSVISSVITFSIL